MISGNTYALTKIINNKRGIEYKVGFKTDVLRTIVDKLDTFKTVSGGDHKASRMFLVNLQKLFSSDVIKAFKEADNEKETK